MQHISVGLGLQALAAVAPLLGCIGLGIMLNIMYSPLWVHLAGWAVVLAAEVLFALHYAWVHSRMHYGTHDRSPPEANDPNLTARQLIRHLRHVGDVRNYLKSWFVDSERLDWDRDIRRDNLKELYAYALWYKTLQEMQQDGLMQDLEDLILQLEGCLGSSIAAGYNPNVKFMSHLWDPINHVYRPLVFYGVMEFLALVQYVALTAAGFRLQRMRGVSYYTYNLPQQQPIQSKPVQGTVDCNAAAQMVPGRSTSSSLGVSGLHRQQTVNYTSPAADSGSDAGSADHLPIVFLHGVGAGLLPYLALVFNIVSLGRPMILPESKHVSMRLVRWLPTVDDMADTTAAILQAHGVERAIVMGHSYGTFVASRLVLKYQGLVHSLCLMDPVCFAMFMPDLVKNFLYARHNSGCLVIDIIMALVSTELHCRTALSRRFWWTSINLWDDAIPERTLVVLSGRDILSPTAHLNKWLTEHTHAQVLYKPGMAHAGVLVDLHWQDTVIEAFKQLIDRPAGSAAAAATVAAAETADTAEEVAAAADVCQAQEDKQPLTQPGAIDSHHQASSDGCGRLFLGGSPLTNRPSSVDDDTACEDQLPSTLSQPHSHAHSSSCKALLDDWDMKDSDQLQDIGITKAPTGQPTAAPTTTAADERPELDVESPGAVSEDEVFCIATPRMQQTSKQQQKVLTHTASDDADLAVQDYVGMCREVC